MAFGDEGDAALGAPPLRRRSAARHSRQLDSFRRHLEGKDGTAVKRTLVQTTDSWERPFDKFECHLDYVVRAPGGPGARPAAGALARGSFTAESPLTVGSYDDAALREACGGCAVDGALSLAVKQMSKGETAEVRLDAKAWGGEGAWVEITPELVGEGRGAAHRRPGTTAATATTTATSTSSHRLHLTTAPPPPRPRVLRKVLHDPKDVYERPNEDATCTVVYTVTLVGGASLGESKSTFAAGDRAVLPALDDAVREMKAGEKCLVTAPAAWGYGAPGWAERAPDEAAKTQGVAIECELVSFERAKDAYEMSPYEKLAAQARKKEQGNARFRAGDIKGAVGKYERAASYYPSDADLEKGKAYGEDVDGQKAAARATKLSCKLNLANCELKLGEWAKAEKAAADALEIDAGSVKALYRRGQARLQLGELDGAKADLMDAAKREPQNREVRKELESLKAKQAERKAEEKAAFGGKLLG